VSGAPSRDSRWRPADSTVPHSEGEIGGAELYLTQVLNRLAKEYPNTLHQIDVRLDSPEEAIEASADMRETDLVVMATHSRSGVGQLLMGSVANAVLRHGRVPLVLIHPESLEQTKDTDQSGDSNVVVADWVDLRVAEEDLPVIREALERFGAQESIDDAIRMRFARILTQVSSK
jgi:hypothetical protein